MRQRRDRTNLSASCNSADDDERNFNLNKAAAGVYSQKSLNLSASKGQTVRDQFTSTTGSSAITTFRVDDTSLK